MGESSTGRTFALGSPLSRSPMLLIVAMCEEPARVRPTVCPTLGPRLVPRGRERDQRFSTYEHGERSLRATPNQVRNQPREDSRSTPSKGRILRAPSCRRGDARPRFAPIIAKTQRAKPPPEVLEKNLCLRRRSFAPWRKIVLGGWPRAAWRCLGRRPSKPDAMV